MKTQKRVLAWVLAVALILTYSVTGLVIPATAGAVAPGSSKDLLNGMGTFESDTVLGTAGSLVTGGSPIADNPLGSGKVVEFQAGKSFYGKWGKLWNAESGAYDGALEAGKVYRLTFDMYGDDFALYFTGATLIGRSGPDNGSWTKFEATETWTQKELYFRVNDGIDLNYGSEFNKKGGGFSGTNDGSTYLDNVVLTEIQAGDNLMFNSSFTYGFKGWPSSVSGTSLVEGAGPNGETVLKMQTAVDAAAPANSIVDMWYKTAFNGMLKTDTTYVFSFDYKNEGVGNMQLDVVTSGSDWTDWKDTEFSASEWTTAEIEFTTGANISTNAGWEWQLRRRQWDTQPGEGATYVTNFSLKEKVTVLTTDVVISNDTLTLEDGSEATLTFAVVPENGTYTAVTWSSDNENVVTVDENGNVTAVGTGTANVTVVVQVDSDVSVIDTCAVTVVPKSNLLKNGDFESGATGWNRSGNSTGTGFAQSSQILEGVGRDGSWGLKVTTEIDTATYTGGGLWPGAYYGGAFYSQLKKNTTYQFSFDYKNEGKGFSQFQVNISPASDWTGWKTQDLPASADWSHYTIEFTTGSADFNTNSGWELYMRHVQYKNVNGSGAAYFDNFKLAEKPVLPAESVTLNKETATLAVNTSEVLEATLSPIPNSYDSITWSSDNDAVATVEQDGTVTGVATGTANITVEVVSAAGIFTDTCAVEVVVPATDFAFKQDALHMAPSMDSDKINNNETLDIVATPEGAYTGTIEWSSDNSGVASVDANGLVTSHAAGTATITATMNGTVSHSITVTVDADGERITGGDFEGTDWNIKNYWTQHIIKDGVGTLVADPLNPNTNTVLAIPAETTSAKWMWPSQVDPGKTYKVTFKALNSAGKAVLYAENSYVSAGGGWNYRTIAKDGWTEVSFVFTTVETGLNRNYVFGFANQTNEILFIDDVSMVEAEPEVGSCGPNATYVLDAMGNLTISGTGSLANNAFNGNTNIVNVEIPDGITSIGVHTFKGCTNLTSVVIPSTVTAINFGAFNGCTSLSTINIPYGVRSIRNSAFKDCKALKKISLPYSVEVLDSRAFEGSGLTSVSVPHTVRTVGSYAFRGCTDLEIVALASGVVTVSEGAFSGCTSLATFMITNTVDVIGDMAFLNCKSLTEFTVPANIATISARTFDGCSALTSVELPESVTAIETDAFRGCNAAIFKVFKDSFAHTYVADNAKAYVLNGVEILESGTCGTAAVYTLDENGHLLISGKGEIAANTFDGRTDIVSVEIGAGITSIGTYAFRGCTELVKVTLPDGVKSVKYGAFSGCVALANINLPDSITEIRNSAFMGCAALTEVVLPANLTKLEMRAFENCTGLTSVTVPESATTIGTYVFRGCTDVVLTVVDGSAAHTYAEANALDFVLA